MPGVGGYRCVVTTKAFDVTQLLMLLRFAVTSSQSRSMFGDLGMRGTFEWRNGWTLINKFQDRPYFLAFE